MTDPIYSNSFLVQYKVKYLKVTLQAIGSFSPPIFFCVSKTVNGNA